MEKQAKAKRLPPLNILMNALRYEPETGGLYWVSARKLTLIGKQAGTISAKGYRQVSIHGGLHMAHRICFALAHGKDPYGMDIDHINGDQTDNRLENLRIASPVENMRNKKIYSSNKTGVAGVHFSKSGRKFIAKICSTYLGTFDSLDQAMEAKKAAESEMGFHQNHGKPVRVALYSIAQVVAA